MTDCTNNCKTMIAACMTCLTQLRTSMTSDNILNSVHHTKYHTSYRDEREHIIKFTKNFLCPICLPIFHANIYLLRI